jgi:hypothetical protein
LASFDGYDLGIIEAFTTEAAPAAFQKNSFPGVNGYERLWLGARGDVHHCRSAMAGVDVYDLAAMFRIFRAYQKGGGGFLLIDADGTYWPNTVLTRFAPIERRYLLGVSGERGVARRVEFEWETDL